MANTNNRKGQLTRGAALFFCALPLIARQSDEDLAAESHRAKEFMAAGQFEQAIPIYRTLVAAVPGNPGLLLNLGLAEEMGGHPQLAIPHFQAVLRSQPDNVPALTSLGTSALQTNQPKLATAPLEKLLQLEPSDHDARGMLAGAYMSLNRFSEAATQYRKLTTETETDPKAWYGLGKSYEALSGKVFDQLAKSDPQSPYVAALLADSRFQRKQYRSAFFFYRQAESKLPQLPGLHAGLAKVYDSTDHPDWATTERQAENAMPVPICTSDADECEFLHGEYLAVVKPSETTAKPETLFWKTKAYNELARNAFDHLGSLPESVEIHALKAEILHGHGQEVEAANEWRAALALSPGNARLQTEVATSLFLAHRYDDVIPMLAPLLAQQPNAPDLNFMLGESLWRTQQPEKALPYLAAALKAQPDMLSAHGAIGMVYALLNQNAEAVPHLEKAVSQDDDGSLHYSLARAYQAIGNSAQAQTAMQGYQQIRQRNQEVNDQIAKESEITPPTPAR